MSHSAVLRSVRRLRSLMAAQQDCEASDEQLLAAFADRRDEVAFATLVRRHGPMVLGVCRRVLGHIQDAEDAYQAAFLVLARRAATLRDKTALGSFLHGIAYHLASNMKRAAGRRRKYESQTPARLSPDPADELLWREVRELLDEEIARLPEKYRSVFVLCCLENLSRTEAGQRLGLKERTVLSRLAEARKRLAQRLSRRGVELTTVLAAIAVMSPPASALPMALMANTIEASLAAAGGEKLAGIVSASVVELVQNAAAAMTVSKAKVAAVVLLIATTSSSLVGLSWRASGPLAPTMEPPTANAGDKPHTVSPNRESMNRIEIRGRILDPDGKPKAGAKLLLLEEGDKARQLGSTSAEGRFTVLVPKEARGGYLLAHADRFGIDFLLLSKSDPKNPVVFRLVKDRPIHGRIVNTEGKPATGVRVAVDNLGVYANGSLDSFLAAWKSQQSAMRNWLLL